MLNWDLENEIKSQGYNIICGCDEAGRGPLAGEVAAAACILPLGIEIKGLNDSKKLSEKKREALFDVICRDALAFSVASASPQEIDEYNILGATMLAMGRAILGLEPAADFALIDGNTVKNIPIPAVGIVKGDAISASISAASILAKVTRDRICLEQDALYPQYGIKGHKGYPTPAHMEAVRIHGPSPIHRRSFLKFLEK